MELDWLMCEGGINQIDWKMSVPSGSPVLDIDYILLSLFTCDEPPRPPSHHMQQGSRSSSHAASHAGRELKIKSIKSDVLCETCELNITYWHSMDRRSTASSFAVPWIGMSHNYLLSSAEVWWQNNQVRVLLTVQGSVLGGEHDINISQKHTQSGLRPLEVWKAESQTR